MKTYVATPATRERNWLVVDAAGRTLGRLATQIADALRGKRKPEYTPHCDVGDFVIVVNAEKISVTGEKRQQKRYYRHSGYPGGLRSRTLEEMLERVAEAYDSEVEITSQKVTSMIEPILIVALSLIVGFIVVAILLPILQIGNLAGKH